LTSRPDDIILVVDDELSVLRMVTTVLASTPYRAVVAEDGHSGWETFLRVQDQVRLVLTDVVMPSMSGLELASKIREIRPEVKILLMTGYTDEVVEPESSFDLPLMRKPFLADDLRRRIAEMLESKSPSS